MRKLQYEYLLDLHQLFLIYLETKRVNLPTLSQQRYYD